MNFSNSPFISLYYDNGTLRPCFQYLCKTKQRNEKVKAAKERMRQFMCDESLHQCLEEVLHIVEQSRHTGEECHNHRLSNGMSVGEFCARCIYARWSE